MSFLNNWLSELGMLNVQNVTVTLTNGKRKQYEMVGCEYNNPKIENQPFIYCLGDYANVPLKSTSRTTAVYLKEDTGDYFIVSSYATGNCLDEPYKQFHPWGLSVILCPVSAEFVENEKRYNKVVEGYIVIK